MSVATFDPLSKQFDTTREEITSLFRDRIFNNKRSKLTKQELEELIDIFVTRLQSLDNAELIQQLCQDEIALLEEGYPQATVAKNHLPKYRKAIQRAIDENRIVLDGNNSHSYTYFKDGEEHYSTEHWALTYLKYTQADYEKFAKATTANNNLKQDSLKPVNKQLYLEAVSSLLESSQPEELAIAIAAVTGRRYSEVMARGEFSFTDNPYQIHFKGQLKKRTAYAPCKGASRRSKKRGSDDDSYTIYTLVPADFVLAAISRFRTHSDIAALDDASIEEINQLNTPINRKIEHYLQDTNLVPVLKSEAGVTIQNLRGIYGEIAVHFFCPPNVGTHRFVQQKLGHLINDSDLSQRKNSGSTEHYFHYYLVDDDGKQLAQKGVKLEQLSVSQNEGTIIQSDRVQSKSQIQQLALCEEENLSSGSTNSDKPIVRDTTELSSKSLMNETESAIPRLEKTGLVADRIPRSKNSSPLPVQKKVKIASLNPPKEEISDRLNHSQSSQLPSDRAERDRYNKITSNNSTLLQIDELSEFLTPIQTLIDSDDYRSVLVGLMASTGLDAASLLKLLVFKEAAAPHLILYCQQLHSPHQSFQQLLTLLNSEIIMEAIANLRRDRNAVDFASSKTMDEINQEVQLFTPNVLESVGLSPNLDLRGQYHDLIPLLLKEESDRETARHSRDRNTLLSVSEDTYSSIEQWQQRIGCDLDTTLKELMVLASSALSDRRNEDSSRVQFDSSSFPPDERLPWLAVSQLANTVNLLAQQVVRQSDSVINSQSPNPKHYTNRNFSNNSYNSAPASELQSNIASPSSSKQNNSLQLNNSDLSKAEVLCDRHDSFDESKVKNLKNQQQKSLSVEESSPLPVDETLKNIKSDELRSSRANGAPIEKCNRALAAVLQYNQQQELPEQMWRINISLLQQLTGSFYPIVKKFVKAHQSIIDEHNQHFGLTKPRHNGVHNDTDPNDLIHW